MKENKTKPDIRFKGFTEAWEQRKLIDLCDYVDYRGKTPNKSDSGIFLVTAKNVKDGYIDYDVSKEYIPEDKYEEVMRRGKPKIGDVLITTEAPCGNVAQVNKPNIALAQRIIKYRGHNQVIDNTYLKYYLLSPFFQNILNMKSSGGTVQGIKGSVLHQQKISFTKYTEQLKIGQCLDSLDSLITLHQRECDQLKELKKSMLKKMFPRDESSIPEVRFAGFTDAWEQRKLGTLCSLITKGTTPKDKSGNGEVNFIKVENIDIDNGEITSTSKISIAEHEGYLKRSKLKENDILFSIAGTLGRVSVVKSSILPANTNQALAILRINEGYIPYLTTVLKGQAVEDFIRRNPTIGAQPNLSLEQVNNLDISYPNYDEQVRIGQYFSNLDHLITLHQRELEILKNLKKTCLKRMFI